MRYAVLTGLMYLITAIAAIIIVMVADVQMPNDLLTNFAIFLLVFGVPFWLLWSDNDPKQR